jgi:hypothetical protein
MRGYDKFNFPAFDAARVTLVHLGWIVVSPADLDREEGFDPDRDSGYDFDVQSALRRDFAAIAERCGHIAFLPGWEKSTGANAEKLLAEMTGCSLWIYDPEYREEGSPTALRPFGDRNRDQKEIITNPVTGGQKETRLARTDLIPARPLWLLAELYGRGARKYSDRNWERGYAWSLSYGAMLRHALLFWTGEEDDPETGSPHLASVAWHALALLEFGVTHRELDDRPLTRT